MPMRDARFGQFADPNFGASLTTPQPSQGVLPAPEASTSASSDQSNGTNTFGMPGLMGQNRGSNPRSVYLAEGGVVPDGQDSGDAAPTQADPFSMIKSALQVGRKQYGLPTSFFGGNDQPDPMEDAQHFADGGEVPGEPEGDNDADDQQGVIPDGNTDQEDQGQQGQMSPSGNAQGAMAYLSGHGAVGPEIAAALERQVDPQGQMDPSLRKMLAINAAGDPNKAFGLMQHYRQKFNALGAFAKAALTGSGGRPPNPAAAADALNQAYDHVPDGKALHFRPTQGGMQVTVHDVVPGGAQQPQQNDQQDDTQSFANGGPVNNSGGSTEDADFNYETAGSQTPSGSFHDRDLQADAAQAEPDDSGEDWETRKKRRADKVKGFGDKVGGMIGNALSPTEGEAEGYRQIGGAIARGAKALNDTQDYSAITKPANAVKNFVLSIPALIGWQSKDGQFDSVVDKGADTTLAAASKMGQPPQESEGSIGPGQVADQSGAGPGPGAVDPNSAYQQGVQNDAAARQADFNSRQGNNSMAQAHKPTPTGEPEEVGSKIGSQAKEDGLTIKDALHQIDIAYGNWAGQQKAKALAKAAVIKEFSVEQVKGQNSLDRARIAGQYGVQRAATTGAAGVERAHIGADASIQKGETHEAAATGRTKLTNETKTGIADKNRDSTERRTEYVQGELTKRNDTTNKPGMVGNKEKIDAAAAARTPSHIRPAAGQQQQQPQLPPEAAKALKEGQNTKFKNGQVWTLRGGQPVQVQ